MYREVDPSSNDRDSVKTEECDTHNKCLPQMRTQWHSVRHLPTDHENHERRRSVGRTHINLLCVQERQIFVLEGELWAADRIQIGFMVGEFVHGGCKRRRKFNVTYVLCIRNLTLFIKPKTHTAPSGKMIWMSALFTTAPLMGVMMGTSTVYLPVALSQLAESANGESQPRVKL